MMKLNYSLIIIILTTFLYSCQYISLKHAVANKVDDPIKVLKVDSKFTSSNIKILTFGFKHGYMSHVKMKIAVKYSDTIEQKTPFTLNEAYSFMNNICLKNKLHIPAQDTLGLQSSIEKVVRFNFSHNPSF